MAEKDLGHPVAPAVDLPVGVSLPFENQERFVGHSLCHGQKAIQYRLHPTSALVELHAHPGAEHFQQVAQVQPEVGEEEPLHEVQGQQRRRAGGETGQKHGCSRGEQGPPEGVYSHHSWSSISLARN